MFNQMPKKDHNGRPPTRCNAALEYLKRSSHRMQDTYADIAIPVHDADLHSFDNNVAYTYAELGMSLWTLRLQVP